ncbi:hypothetical protein W911_04495 [Hyphomicrobium nitrativorans NL23]|uniref:Uncharacterized protein n=1 Tax=Hyphomicrobium nitrativorans NL23 TaxID=1029756 RepID=V5SHG3_9HYPH|nr:hypothetical protein W911_04495 [Hyphomicrobium nitrativorans NL23]
MRHLKTWTKVLHRLQDGKPGPGVGDNFAVFVFPQ